MEKPLPAIIQQVGFDFDWSEKKVWELDYPIEEISVQELAWHFTIPFWNTENGFYDLTPNEVINDPQKHSAQHKRILSADLSYPIDIMQNKRRWLVLDGLHQLAKAKMLGHSNVSVRKIPRSEIPNIRKDRNTAGSPFHHRE